MVQLSPFSLSQPCVLTTSFVLAPTVWWLNSAHSASKKREIIFCLLNKLSCLIKGSDWFQRQQKKMYRITQPECNGKRRYRISCAGKLAQLSCEIHISCHPHLSTENGTDNLCTVRFVPGNLLSIYHLVKLRQTPQEFDYLDINKTLLPNHNWNTHNVHISLSNRIIRYKYYSLKNFLLAESYILW